MLLQTKVKVNGPSSDHIQHIPNPQIPNFFVNYVSKFWYEPQLREADPFQNGWFFGKVPGGGSIFNPKIYVADFCHYRRYFGHEFQKQIMFLPL